MNPPLFLKKPPQHILVISLRFLGDTLLTTPLINSLKKAYPNAQIDILIYKNNAAILEGNTTISNLITTVQKPKKQDYIDLLKQIFRRYDLSVCTQIGDRPSLYAFLAAPIRVGLVPQKKQKGWFKRYLFQKWCEFDLSKTHTVLELLRLCDLLNIAPVYELTPPSSSNTDIFDSFNLSERYIVIHPMPQWRYKQWTQTGWTAIAEDLIQQGYQIIFSGSPEKKDIHYIREIQQKISSQSLNIAGKLTLAQLANLIKNAQLFIGVDTGITHLASATGIKTIVLFGPSDPIKWTPWPKNYHSKIPPFTTHGNQQVNNVYLIQGSQNCVPCYLEGCNRHQQSHSDCLDDISAKQVKKVINKALNNE